MGSGHAATAMVRSLGIPNFRRYFIGSSVSNVGVWMMRTGQSWVVLHLGGGSGAALGVVTFLQFAPTLLFSVAAGGIADRFDKATVLCVTQTLIGLAGLGLAVLDVLDVLSLAWVYLLSAWVGILTAFDAPVRQTFAAELVGPENVVNAVGLNTASFNVARLVGPVVAALLITAVGTWSLFLINFLSSGAIVASLLRIDRSRLFLTPGGGSRGGWASGFTYVAGSPTLLCFIALAGLGNAFGANSLQVLLPIVATEIFAGGALEFGLLTSALAVGGLVGALTASAQSGRPRTRAVLAAVVAFGASLVLASASPSMPVLALTLVVVGGTVMGFVVLVNTSVQMSAPVAVRGRVVAVYMMFFLGGGALGAPLLGLLADLFGPMQTLWMTGSVLIAAGAASALLLHRTRSYPAPARGVADTSPGTAAGFSAAVRPLPRRRPAYPPDREERPAG